MIIGDNFVFIHFQKAAGTYIRNFVLRAFHNCIRLQPEHNGVRNIPPKHRHKKVIGTVRNPWDWYVSWWASRQASMIPPLSTHSSRPDGFLDLFDVSFKEFLKRCLFTEKRQLHDVDFSVVRELDIGPFTYRYNKCFKDPEITPTIIKIENLRDGIIKEFNLNKKQIELLDALKQDRETANTSEHKDYKSYYDKEMWNWVYEKEKDLIKKHNYD